MVDFAEVAAAQQRFEKNSDFLVEIPRRLRGLLREFPADPLQRGLRAAAEGVFRGDVGDVAEIDWSGGGRERRRGFRGEVRGSARRTRRRICSGRESCEAAGCSASSAATAAFSGGSATSSARSARMADLRSSGGGAEAKTRAATRCHTCDAFCSPAGERGETGKQSDEEGCAEGCEEGCAEG